jgi:hypothetical protein
LLLVGVLLSALLIAVHASAGDVAHFPRHHHHAPVKTKHRAPVPKHRSSWVKRVRHKERCWTCLSTAVASYYDYEGTECGGWHSNGFAQGIDGVVHEYWPCGTRVEFCYRKHCVIGVRQDSGPYVFGRTFDLTPGLKESLGCPDICGEGEPLYWRRL